MKTTTTTTTTTNNIGKFGSKEEFLKACRASRDSKKPGSIEITVDIGGFGGMDSFIENWSLSPKTYVEEDVAELWDRANKLGSKVTLRIISGK